MFRISIIASLFSLSFFLIFFSPSVHCSSGSFTVNLTLAQYRILFKPYISQNYKKQCWVGSGDDPNICTKYCKLTYDYVSTATYKNYMYYNSTSRYCEPKPYCATGYLLNRKLLKCVKTTNTSIMVSPTNAPAPNYTTVYLITINCVHGYVGTWNGKKDCICDFAWGSKPTYANQDNLVNKCSFALSLVSYFPNYKKIYYNRDYDNICPYSWESDIYWQGVALCLSRRVKQNILQYFYPVSVQMIMAAIPMEDTFKASDLIWFSWIVFGISVLFLFTFYEKCIRGISASEEQEMEQQNGK